MKWHYRMLKLARVISAWSKDPSTKVGCVIYDHNNRIVSTGYNGFPKGIDDLPERFANRDFKYKVIRHAEANALSFANQNLEKCTLVSTHFPCTQCAASIIQAGITTIITCKPEEDFMSRWGEDVNISMKIFEEAGVTVVLY